MPGPVAQQVGQRAGHDTHVVAGAGRRGGCRLAIGADFDERDALGVVDLVERILQQGARVVDAIRADRLRPVEVAECDEVEAVKGVGGDHAGTPDRERPLGVGFAAAGDEGVRHQDIALPGLSGRAIADMCVIALWCR